MSDGAAERNRVQKILEDANMKIGDVLSDVFGVSAQAMLEALLENKRSATKSLNWHTGGWHRRFRGSSKRWKAIA